MRHSLLRIIVLLCISVVAATFLPATLQAQWTAVTPGNLPGFLNTCLVLTNGDAICQQYSSNQWYRLTPDINGSYANGTWTATAPMPNGTDTSTAGGGCKPCAYAPLYYYSGILPDGRMVVVGGEYNSNGNTRTDIGFIYNPVTNSWSSQLTGLWGAGSVGDAQGIILKNGTMLLARAVDFAPGSRGDIASLNPATGVFTQLHPTGKADSNNEENWNILPNGKVLTVNTRIASQFEIYDPATNSWTSGPTPVNLADTARSSEVGPGVLRPDGTLIYFSGNSLGQNALYNTQSGVWTNSASMNFPLVTGQTYHYSVADGVASLLPNGNVLVMASPVTPSAPFNAGSRFYEFDMANNLNAVAGTPNAASFIGYQGRMVLLPSGDVLLTAHNQQTTQDVYLYNNGGAPDHSWRPVITSPPTNVAAGGTNYPISGRLFNGFSEGASYGDDAAMSTNYPLVRIKNKETGHIFYARTHNHSRMGVDLISSLEEATTYFDVPASLESGPSELVVVVNGIPSTPVTINAQDLTITKTHSPSYFEQGKTGNTFYLNVSNVGTSPTVGTVTVVDTLPAKLTATAISGPGWTCTLATLTCTRNEVLAAGNAYPTINLTVNVAADAPISVTNKATVSGGGEVVTLPNNNTSQDQVSVVQHTTTTVDPVTGHYHDQVTLSATVTPAGVTGSVEFFVNGSSVGLGTYNSVTGVATKAYVINLAAGTGKYNIKAVFSTNEALYRGSEATRVEGLTVTHEETTLTYTGQTVIANGGKATMAANLVEDGADDSDGDGGSVPIAGRTVKFTLGTGATKQSCSANTNAAGAATCDITPVNQPLGPGTVLAEFAKDNFYQASSASADTILFAFLSTGSFAAGDLSAVSGAPVTWWQDDWYLSNNLTGGVAPSSFKGFVNQLSTAVPACGAPWSTGQSGNSVRPPAAGAIPLYMGVVVSSQIRQQGAASAGDTAAIVVVKTNPGYDGNPGHYGTGTVVATYCQ